MNFIDSVPSLVGATTSTTTKATSSSGSSAFLLVLIVVFAAIYLLVLRPNQRRRAQIMRQNAGYEVGDEVIAGGMVGRVVRIGDGEVDIKAGNDVFTFVPQAVQSRAAFMARNAGGRGGVAGRAASSGPSSSPGGRPSADDAGHGAVDEERDVALEEGDWPSPTSSSGLSGSEAAPEERA